MAYTYNYNPTMNTYNPTYYPVPPPHTYPSPYPMAPPYIYTVVPPVVYPTAVSARVYVPQQFPYVPFNPGHAFVHQQSRTITAQDGATGSDRATYSAAAKAQAPLKATEQNNNKPAAQKPQVPQGHAFVHQQSRTITAQDGATGSDRATYSAAAKAQAPLKAKEQNNNKPAAQKPQVPQGHAFVHQQSRTITAQDGATGSDRATYSAAAKAQAPLKATEQNNNKPAAQKPEVPQGHAFVHQQSRTITAQDGATGSDRATYSAAVKAQAPLKATGQNNNKPAAQKPQVPQKTEVIVKNLEYAVDDKQLREKFMPFGTVTSAKVVMKDGRSRGFGFVCFSSLQEANKAITEMNQRRVGRRLMHVEMVQSKEERQAYFAQQVKRRMKSRDAAVASDRAPKPPKRTTVIIKNLDFAVDSKQLHENFMSFGTVISAKVVMKDDRSRGFGFVMFSSPEEANKAIKEMSDKMMGKRPVIVELVQSKVERDAFLAQQKQQKMESKTQSGIFPLSFEHSTSLYTYCRKATVDKPQPSTVSERAAVIVRNLDLTVDDKKLRNTFLQFGTVMTAKVAMVKGCPKGHGIVTFQYPDEAEKAVKEMNGKTLGMKALQLSLQTVAE